MVSCKIFCKHLFELVQVHLINAGDDDELNSFFVVVAEPELELYIQMFTIF